MLTQLALSPWRKRAGVAAQSPIRSWSTHTYSGAAFISTGVTNVAAPRLKRGPQTDTMETNRLEAAQAWCRRPLWRGAETDMRKANLVTILTACIAVVVAAAARGSAKAEHTAGPGHAQAK